MGTYKVDEHTLNQAIGTLNHIEAALEKCYTNLNTTAISLKNQSGLGVQNTRQTINAQKEQIRVQKMNIGKIRDCIQSVINKSAEASATAKRTLEGVDLNQAFTDGAQIIAAATAAAAAAEAKKQQEAAAAASANQGSAGAGNGGNGAFYAANANYYYASVTGREYGGAGCGVYSYAMIMANLGITNGNGQIYTPDDFYNENGGNYVNNDTVSRHGYTVIQDGLGGLTIDEKRAHIRSALQNHPEGVVLRWNSDYPYNAEYQGRYVQHFVVAKGIDENGNIIINDPFMSTRENKVMSTENLSSIANIRIFTK